MKHRLALTVFCLSLAAALLAVQPARAATSTEKGLAITPAKQYLATDAGTAVNSSVNIANLTDKPIVVNLYVKQFSVTDYVYDYRFDNPDNNWVKLGQTQVSLKARSSQKIKYTIDPAQGSSPGGYYYTIFASSKLSRAGVNATVQATNLVYLIVRGTLVKTANLESASVKTLVFGSHVPYRLAVRNTGNVHYFAFTYGELHSALGGNSMPSTTHLLMPDTVRDISGQLKSPTLPGVYKVTYGFKTDSGVSDNRSQYIVYIPIWSIVLLALIAFGLFRLRSGKKTPKP
jgi:hypothetical protein